MSAKKAVIDKYASMRSRDLELTPPGYYYESTGDSLPSKSIWQEFSDFFMGYSEGPVGGGGRSVGYVRGAGR